MRVYRGYILGTKRKQGSARGVILYRDYIETYLWAKKAHLKKQ